MATATGTGVLTRKDIEAARALLVGEDGEPLESPWHRAVIALLIEIITWLWRGRTDYFVGGNMFIYYSMQQAREKKYRGPDFFMVDHVDGTREREYWWVFEEGGRFPDVIVELSSPTTKKDDHTVKKDLYEQLFKTPEYFCYDPKTKRLEGWRLRLSGYQPIEPNERGLFWSERFQLYIGTWKGTYLRKTDTWLRFYDARGNLLPTEAEELRNLLQEHGISISRLKSKRKNGRKNGK
jgi:Uma2 family endonuclease